MSLTKLINKYSNDLDIYIEMGGLEREDIIEQYRPFCLGLANLPCFSYFTDRRNEMKAAVRRMLELKFNKVAIDMVVKAIITSATLESIHVSARQEVWYILESSYMPFWSMLEPWKEILEALGSETIPPEAYGSPIDQGLRRVIFDYVEKVGIRKVKEYFSMVEESLKRLQRVVETTYAQTNKEDIEKPQISGDYTLLKTLEIMQGHHRLVKSERLRLGVILGVLKELKED